jgi:hypothetical protein
MPGFPAALTSNPAFWRLWGHSYMQHGFGPRLQSGRIDAFFRAMLGLEYGDFYNFAVTGARLSVEGRSQGGFARILNNCVQDAPSTGPSGPAVSGTGAHLNVYGINDLGFNGPTAQYNAAYGQAARAVISRQRMSWLRPNAWAGSAGTGVYAYGAGFINTATNGEYTTGLSSRNSTATGTVVATGSTITFTLASDYNGEVIASLWIANPGVAGATITKSGTAGVTGTFSTSNIMVSGSLNHSPVCDRIKGLTAANAGQTIVYTVTSTDSGATTQFDSIWGEALNPPPVLWCNTARLTATGYAIYGTIGDPDVLAFNAIMPPILAEFDGMVQLVDIDAAIGKDPTALIYDGLHPNELGAARVADAIVAALGNCTSSTASKYGLTANLQSPGPRSGPDIIPHRSGFWHTAVNGGIGTANTPAANDLWALPLLVTSSGRRIIQWSYESVTGTVAPTAWFAIYDDRAYSGFPCDKYVDTTPSTAVTLTTGTAIFNSSLTGGVSGNISQPVDPGLYWLVVQFATIGTSTTCRTIKGGSQYMPNLATTGGAFGATSLPIGYKLAGAAAGPLPKTFPTTAVLIDNVPMIGVKFQ